MPKRKQERNTVEDVQSSDDEFCTVYLDTDVEDTYNNSSSDTGGDTDCIKKRVKHLEISSDSELEDFEIFEGELKEYTAWHEVTSEDINPPKLNFSPGPKNVGPQTPESCVEPIDFFKLFFTDELLSNIIEQTNRYANEKIKEKNLSKRSIWNNWVDVTVEEMSAFIGVILNMGIIITRNLKDYWSQQHNSRIPFFYEIFRRARFQQIFWMLHLHVNVSNDKSITTRIQKIGNYLDYIDNKFKEYFVPGKELYVDESIVKFKGRSSFVTYNPKKLTKWGIRIYILVDSNTGYIYSFLPYYGSYTVESLMRSELPVTSRIVLHLYQQVLNFNPEAQGYHIFTDRSYTNLILAQELLKLKCYITGTMQPKRKYVPEIIKEPEFKDNNVFACRSGNLLLLAWKDKEVITMLSTLHSSEMESVNSRVHGGVIVRKQKPRMIIEYDKHMGCADKIDHSNSYTFLRKSHKWWRKLFFWGLELCARNSYILYKESLRTEGKTPMAHLIFLRKLVDQLVGSFRDGCTSRGRPSTSDKEERLNGKLHILRRNDRGRSRDCLVCSNRRVKGGRRESAYHCDTCSRKPGLHIGDCFEKYHTQENYKTQYLIKYD
ncbi:piggyBac transposable element-derived protein 4-like [Hylaeus volcanicus]|uniref:piggyBac transposable element-derived protein 4-like n=1 Tax=Hylaeus volcanicus TaxID=313075 RepID=UPI0023B802ED|nr:piggyBac transposable element-derived protein 4-like [Hylaeus volcanicus]